MRPALVKRHREDAEDAARFEHATRAKEEQRKRRRAEQGRCLGWVSTVAQGLGPGGRSTSTPEQSFDEKHDRMLTESRIRVSLAGAASQRRFTGTRRGDEHDERRTNMDIARIVGDDAPEAFTALRRRLERAVRRDLRRPDVERAVRALARTLMSERRVPGKRAEALIRRALLAPSVMTRPPRRSRHLRKHLEPCRPRASRRRAPVEAG